MISTNTIDEVINSANIVDIIGNDIKLKKSGAKYTGKCPFHGDKNSSLFVYPETNTYHCFGCQAGSSVVDYVMQRDSISFTEAIRKIALEHNIKIDEHETDPITEQESMKREALLIAAQEVNKYFVTCLNKTKKAQEYINKRWDPKFAENEELGYADEGWQSLYNYAGKMRLNISVLEELGVLRKKEKGGYYDFLRDRITIPVKDKNGRICGWSARYIGEKEEEAKYLNSPDSQIFKKSELLMGYSSAKRAATKAGRIYIVEGAPDMLRLKQIGAHNTVAPLGTALTDKQINLIKKCCDEIVFIPDIEPSKAGEKAVISNGKLAINKGLNVTVKLIPSSIEEKRDPDSFIINSSILQGLHEEDYILWLADRLFSEAKTVAKENSTRKEIGILLAAITDDQLRMSYIDKLTSSGRKYGTKKMWQDAIGERSERNVEVKDGQIDRDAYQKYNFFAEHNCYYSYSNDGDKTQWSNFTMKPLFHILDSVNPKRLFELTNVFGHKIITEMKQEDLTSLNKFQNKVEGAGNYIWESSQRDLIKLKKYLYDQTETAKEVKQMGWSKEGKFYAWGNGAYIDGDFNKVDDYGIVRLETGNFYLPAASKIYAEDRELFQYERKFVCNGLSTITMYEYTSQLLRVYGDNSKIGICFLIAGLFKDIIVRKTTSFPVLNLFGPKGAGKSVMGSSLMSFFIARNTPPNLSNATIPALADVVAQCANALVHLDEFKNDIDLEKREFLKGLWDNAGRSRMNMDRDKKREITSVDSGIIVSGQEMATADIALFSRFIFVSFYQTTYTEEESRQFEKLKQMEEFGLSHLTNQILRYRNIFEQEYNNNYKIARNDIEAELIEEKVETRILNNWITIIAAFRTIKDFIQCPWEYDDLIPIFAKGIIAQNKECKSHNELSEFWNYVAVLKQDSQIFIESDYRIDTIEKITPRTGDKIEYSVPKRVLRIRTNRIFDLYQKGMKSSGQKALPKASLTYYLEKSKEFICYEKAVRFKQLFNGFERAEIKDGTPQIASTPMAAMTFDYDAIEQYYDIVLEDIFTNK